MLAGDCIFGFNRSVDINGIGHSNSLARHGEGCIAVAGAVGDLHGIVTSGDAPACKGGVLGQLGGVKAQGDGIIFGGFDCFAVVHLDGDNILCQAGGVAGNLTGDGVLCRGSGLLVQSKGLVRAAAQIDGAYVIRAVGKFLTVDVSDSLGGLDSDGALRGLDVNRLAPCNIVNGQAADGKNLGAIRTLNGVGTLRLIKVYDKYADGGICVAADGIGVVNGSIGAAGDLAIIVIGETFHIAVVQPTKLIGKRQVVRCKLDGGILQSTRVGDGAVDRLDIFKGIRGFFLRKDQEVPRSIIAPGIVGYIRGAAAGADRIAVRIKDFIAGADGEGPGVISARVDGSAFVILTNADLHYNAVSACVV